MDMLHELTDGIETLEQVLAKAMVLKASLEQQEQQGQWEQFVGKLCLFYDKVDDKGRPQGSMIRLFHHHEYRQQEAPNCHHRYIAADIYGTEIGHPWRYFKVLRQRDLVDCIM